jgi:hypothetical protein
VGFEGRCHPLFEFALTTELAATKASIEKCILNYLAALPFDNGEKEGVGCN